MKKGFSKFTAAVSVFLFLAAAAAFARGKADLPLSGKVVILHSNDVHGAIESYACIAQLKNDYEAQGAAVILADAGDFMQGTPYVSTSKGADAVTMMNAAGYDVAALGNHEFDYGRERQREALAKARFSVLCADVFDEDGRALYPATKVVKAGGVKVGFVGITTPYSKTSVNPSLIWGLSFAEGDEFYALVQANIDALKSDGADVVIALAHLGVASQSVLYTSTNLYAATSGLDFIIDGHSHTVMTAGENGEPIQSTGTEFAYIGVVVIDSASKRIEENYLLPVTSANEDGSLVKNIESDPKVAAAAQKIIDRVDGEYNVVFAETLVDLNGDRAPGNRTEETNLGSFIADAMLWSVLQVEGSLEVESDYAVSMTNGGGIRASIPAGEITRKDISAVLPFGNTINVIYVTGAEILEALEASTYCTPDALGSFPQVSGIEFTIDTSKEYDSRDTPYPASTYYGPASINRITIDSVNGKPFDPDALYAVITNEFMAAGGGTYYAFAAAERQFDTGIADAEAVMSYITDFLGGVIGAEYAEPFGRIHVMRNSN